ncbi:MAG: YibE/F family protein, partial [Candidatus Magasanikbacteria bacterium]|nr:YibE/F family protein [Candidatus Magasanikbacteria bacterium]
GLGNFDVVKKNLYKVGDKVLLDASTDDAGNTSYYITDYIRTSGLKVLLFVFCIVLLLIGGLKGVRSLFSLAISFVVIVKFIIPQILAGANPFWITMTGSFGILLAIIYITEGFRARSHITVISILISLLITLLLSTLFVALAKLSGLASEETMFLISIGGNEINFQGLLLAGIIIGALGVLDDVVISQVTTVEQIIKTDPYQSAKQVFLNAHEVGISHVSSMTNTLFLAYAGASLPLLILFISGESAFSSWGQIINNEAIATEIVRTLTGSVGLIAAVPISTILATWWFVKMKKEFQK